MTSEGEIIVDELNNLFEGLAVVAGGMGIKQWLLAPLFSSTGWGGVAFLSGAAAASIYRYYKVWKRTNELGDITVNEKKTLDAIKEKMEKLRDYIKTQEDLLADRDLKINDPRTDKQLKESYVNEYNFIRNGLESVYDKLVETNLNPIPSPKVEKIYGDCDRDTCNAAGKIRSDKLWGDIDDCCKEAPMMDITEDIKSVKNDMMDTRRDMEKLKIDLLKEIDDLKDSLNNQVATAAADRKSIRSELESIRSKLESIRPKLESIRQETFSVGGGGSERLIIKKHKSKRNKTKRNKSKRNKTKRKKKIS